MRRFLIPLLSVVLMVVSCGPSRHAIHLEMRYPSKSGLDLAGKVISVVYMENDDEQGNQFNEGMADAFAYALEKDYGTGEGSIGIYRMRCEDGVDYADRDHMMDLLVDTDADVRLARRILRDVCERGRTMQSVIDQYTTTVKPMHEEFVEPSKKHADVIIPEGGFNSVAVGMLIENIRSLISKE